MSPTIENKTLLSCLPVSLRSHMIHSFHVFDHAVKAFERDKRLGFGNTGTRVYIFTFNSLDFHA